MSIELYNELAMYEAFNGVKLPRITSAKINITPSKVSIEQVLEQISQFVPTEGWVMYRDCLSISNQIPQRKDILEAEYTNGNDSLIIKHIGNSLYEATKLICTEEATASSGYIEQEIYIRNDLKANATTATYRIWYQEHEYKWNPLVQQLIGFDLPKHDAEGNV